MKKFILSSFIIAFSILFVITSRSYALNDTCANTQNGIMISGNQSTNYDQRTAITSNTLINASTAMWKINNAYPVQIGNGSNICLIGGKIEGLYPDSTTWNILHSTSALYVEGPNFSIKDLRVHNYGDAIRIRNNTDNFSIDHVHFSHIRDDCIENDKLNGGLVENSLFDGCYNAFSARPDSTGTDGRGKIWTIRNSLVRLEPMQEGYNGAKNVHAGFFKWDKSSPSLAPDLVLENNIFRADQNADTVGLGIPPGQLKGCKDNIMVWLGPGNYPEQLPQTFNSQPCFTVTGDKSVWDNAVTKWFSGNSTTPTITPTGTQTCINKSKGDADCKADNNGKSITIVDFEIWRKEFLTGCSTANQSQTSCQADDDNNGSLMDAEFDNDTKVAIADFQIWRNGYFGGI